MLLSVVIPVYNVEKYLEECLDSILGQSFSDFEVILVDDGSKDSSGGICDAYAQKDCRIRVIHKENGGLSDARNAGTECATGDYILYIDSDDFLISDKFFIHISMAINKNHSDIILYKYQKYIDETKEFLPCAFSLDFAENDLGFDETLWQLVKNDSYYGMAWIKAIRRAIMVEHNIIFEKGLLGEDMEWYFHLLTHCETVSAIDESYIAYRQRKGSITSSHKVKNLTDYIYILRKWSQGIENSDLRDKAKTALRGALAKYYANLLVAYARMSNKEKRACKKDIKNLSYLLKYSMNKRPQTISKIYRMFGFDAVIIMLKLYDKAKG